MKRVSLITSAVSAALLVAPALWSQSAAPNLELKDPKALKEAGAGAGTAAPSGAPQGAAIGTNDAGAELDPTLPLLKKLKPEQQEKVKKNINEASAFVSGIRLQEALARLEEVEKLCPGLFMTVNLKGAIFTKMRLFDKAAECFKTANQLNPTSFHPKFNLAEIDFVNDKWAEAQKSFEALISASEAEEKKLIELRNSGGKPQVAKEADLGTRKLMEFKIVICLLKQNKNDEAKKKIEAMSYLDDTPIYYMSHAAVEYAANKKEEAQSWIDSANRIFDQGNLTIYMDSFIECGWVETLTL